MNGERRDTADTDHATAAPRSRTVLVIEDEAVVALFLTDLLSELHYRVCGVVPSGREALALAAEHRPDIAMVDIRIKGDLDGLETARKLADQFGIRCVLLSGDPESLRSAASRGVAPAGILNKPYTPDQLERVLTHAFASQ
jgi:CheY-like chemotaxis protein